MNSFKLQIRYALGSKARKIKEERLDNTVVSGNGPASESRESGIKKWLEIDKEEDEMNSQFLSAKTWHLQLQY
jgi:hypothetical protein